MVEGACLLACLLACLMGRSREGVAGFWRVSIKQLIVTYTRWRQGRESEVFVWMGCGVLAWRQTPGFYWILATWDRNFGMVMAMVMGDGMGKFAAVLGWLAVGRLAVACTSTRRVDNN